MLEAQKGGSVVKKLTPIKAIRQKCLDCCCWSYEEVKKCEMVECTLHPYRLGKRPKVGAS